MKDLSAQQIRSGATAHRAVVHAILRRRRYPKELEQVVRLHRMGDEIAEKCLLHGLFEASRTAPRPFTDIWRFVTEHFGDEIGREISGLIWKTNLDWIDRPVEPQAICWVQLLPGLPFKPLFADDRERIRASRAYKSTTGPPR